MFVFHLLKACDDNEDGVIVIVDQLGKKFFLAVIIIQHRARKRTSVNV